MMSVLAWFEQLPISMWMKGDSLLGYPTFLFLHTLGMSIVAGGSMLLSLALVGLWPPDTPLKPLDRFYPLIWSGMALNAITGVLLLAADATKRLTNPDFYVKMLCVFAGVGLLVVLRRRVFSNPTLDGTPLPAGAKTLAWASLGCWLGAIVSGRLLAYTGSIR